MAGLLGSFFNFVDPILDKIDPMHNKVQTWTTGSSTTEGQRPYFETIAPMVVDAFLPGVGSAIGGLDGASTGNWGKAAIGALGATAQLGSLGSAAADGANGGVAATEASSGLSSTAGVPAGEVAASGTATAAPSTFDASNFGATNSFGQAPTNELGYQGMSSMSGAPESTQFMTMPASDYAAAGGAGQSLGTTTAESTRLANAGLLSDTAGKGTNWGGLATSAGKLYVQQAAEQEKAARERAMMQQMQARQSVGGGDAGAPTGKPAQSFQTLSPYAKFNGGFQGRQYGANVRNRGLLG